jgi:hypothetical protein
MLDWLVDDIDLFGQNGQNWMLLIGGALLLYLAVMVIARRRDRITR